MVRPVPTKAHRISELHHELYLVLSFLLLCFAKEKEAIYALPGR